MAQEDATIRFILEDAGGGAPGREGGQYPGMTKGETEGWLFGKIPPPPPPPSSVVPSLQTGIQPQLQQLATAIQGLTQMTGGPAPPVIPPPVQRPTPPPAPPPIQTPPLEDPSLLQRMMGAIPQSAVPSFVGGIAARATGSATVGGLAGMGAGSIMAGLSAAGPAGIGVAAALAGVVVVGTALTETFQKLRSVASELTDSIREFSPHVAQATAMAEVRMILLRLRRARQIGPELGAYVGAESRLDLAVEELKTTVMRDVTPALSVVVNHLARIVEGVDITYKWFSKEGVAGMSRLEIIARAVAPALTAATKGVVTLDRLLALIEDKKEEDAEALRDFFDNFLDPLAPEKQGAAGRGRAWPVGLLGGGF